MFALFIIVKRKLVIIYDNDHLFSYQLNIESVNASFKNICIVVLRLLTAPILWGWYFLLSTYLIPLFSSHEDNVLFTNSFPLSIWSIEWFPIMNACILLSLIVSVFILNRIFKAIFTKMIKNSFLKMDIYYLHQFWNLVQQCLLDIVHIKNSILYI